MKIHRITSTLELVKEWSIFNEAMNAAEKCPSTPRNVAFKQIMSAVSRPKNESLLLIGNVDGESCAAGVAFEFEGDLWVYVAYVRAGIPDGVTPLLDYCKSWAREQGYTKLVARSEIPHKAAVKLFEKWGFSQRATEFQMTL